MGKPSKNIIYSEIFQTVDKELSLLLEKCNNGKNIENLKTEDRQKLWICVFNLIKQNNLESLSNENIQILKNCLDLIWIILNSSGISSEIKLELLDIVKYINSVELLTEESAVVNCVSRVNEYWMVKMQISEEISGMEYLTLKFLLNLCASEKPLVSDIQRLSAIRKSITADPFDKTIPSLRPILIKLVQKMQVVGLEHGQRFLAQALILSHKIMKEIHKTIMLDLSSCNIKKAQDYGKIYVMAWHGASVEMKEPLEKICFQHLMESMLKEQRTSLDLNKNSQNILAILEVWHSERKKKNPDFITMLTNAYQPILWKYLQSGFNVHRCNATDVFFKAFPLQRSNDNAVNAEKLFNMQYNSMLASLTDDCHIVRIIGIREVCNILSHYWNSFSPVQIQNLMKVITKQNACDASSAEVRKMVYLGLQSLVKSPLSCDYIKQILPNMADNIHDINQKVRIAFIQLLICIKEKKDPNFKYNEIVSMFNLQYRLAKDNIAVGQWIVKLLIKNYYHGKMSVIEWTKRFIYLIKTYRASYRNFFFYSGKSLALLDACTIIYEILNQLGIFVLSKSVSDQENNESIAEKHKEKKKGKKKAPLSDWNECKESSSSSSSSSDAQSGSSKKCAFDDPDVVSGLFDVVTILWVLHDIKLSKPEYEEIRFKLYDTYIKYAQPFINYYKDCDLFLSVLSLSGNIPASLLRSNSITLPGYCIKMLKSIKIEGSDRENEKISSMLIALVKWGRGGEILEQVTLWLDAAFETQNMNETILPRRRVKINETVQPNSVVAIYILDTLLKKEYVKLSILKKSFNELLSLWKFMSRIRKLIETRLDQGEPFSEDLVSDEFLVLCFRRYVKLIPLLKVEDKNQEDKENQNVSETNDVFVNRQKEIENVIEWAENLLFPILQQEEVDEADADLIIALLEDILYVSDNMIILHSVNNLFNFKTAHLVLKLLGTKYGLRFVKASSRVMVAVNYSAKQLFKINDDLQFFSTVIPSLLSHTLNVLAVEKLSARDIGKLQEEMPTIKTSFCKILATFQDNLKSGSNLKKNVRQLKLMVGLFVDCLVTMISQEIPREDSSIPLYSTPSQLPSIVSSLLSLFHNKKSWTPLFIHVINTRLVARSFDIKATVSAILLLHLYANSDKKVGELDLKKALHSARESLERFKESVDKKVGGVEDPMMETEEGARETWHSSAATRGHSTTGISSQNIPQETKGAGYKKPEGCQMITEESEGLNSFLCDGKDQETKGAGDKETEECQTVTEESEDLCSFLCDGKDLEVDFINCGFELINNIEKCLNEQSGHAEGSS